MGYQFMTMGIWAVASLACRVLGLGVGPQGAGLFGSVARREACHGEAPSWGGLGFHPQTLGGCASWGCREARGRLTLFPVWLPLYRGETGLWPLHLYPGAGAWPGHCPCVLRPWLCLAPGVTCSDLTLASQLCWRLLSTCWVLLWA